MVIETAQDILIVDCGLLFSDLDHFGVEYIVPQFQYLIDRKDKIRGIVLTHGHEDHIGAVPFAIKAGVRAPVYASPFTSKMVAERLGEHGVLDRTELKVFRLGDSFTVGGFHVKSVPVNHSIIEASALIIQTPLGKIIHTGDFRIDASPFYGKPLDLSAFRQAGDEGVLLLMSDSTNVERETHLPSEKTVLEKIEQLVAAAEGMIVISMFASNIGRVGQVLQIAKKMGRKVLASGRSMEQNLELAQEAGYLKDAASVLIGPDQFDDYKRSEIICLSTGSQGEARSALTRASVGEHKYMQLEKGDLVVMSSSFIPGNEKAIGRVINNLFKQGADVIYESIEEVHVSGHATRPELKQMLEAVRPRFFLPLHGEYRHLVHHARLAEEVGIGSKNVVVASNGDVLKLTREEFKKEGELTETRTLIESEIYQEMTRDILKERRKLAETGVVFALMTRDPEHGRIVAGPEIISRGLVKPEEEGWLVEEATKLVKKVVAGHYRDRDEVKDSLEETVRIELRRFFNANLGRKPTVVPLILDL